MLEQIISIVREAGEIVLSAHDVWSQTHEKTSAADLVTEYDLAVERFLKEKLPPLVPGSIFFGEEEKENADPGQGWAFIVDPIDGTTNFVRGLRQSAVSVALAKDGTVEYGVVYNPYRDEMFSARRGGGAFLNGMPIHVSSRPLSKGIFSMGTSIYRPEYFARTMRLTEQLFRRNSQHKINYHCLLITGQQIWQLPADQPDAPGQGCRDQNPGKKHKIQQVLCPHDPCSLIIDLFSGHFHFHSLP